MLTARKGTLMRVAHRVGRRGCFLLFLALLDLLLAYSMTPAATVAKLPTYAYLSQYLPLQAWAGIWAGVGIICGIQAFARRDHAAFTVAVALKLVWATLYIAAWMEADVPRGWVGAVLFYALGGVTAIIASWPESRSLMLAALAAEHAARERAEREERGDHP
jgi:hypothetical protein